LDNFSLTNLSKPPCNGQGQSRAVLAVKDDNYDSNCNSVNYSIFVKGYHRQMCTRETLVLASQILIFLTCCCEIFVLRTNSLPTNVNTPCCGDTVLTKMNERVWVQLRKLQVAVPFFGSASFDD